MGKLIRNGIEYGGGNGTDIFEVTQAEYDALKQAGTLVHNALYVITDAPNLNPTASDIEYSSGVTVKQAIDSKANASTFARKSVNSTSAITVSANTIDTQDFTVNDSNYNLVVGFMVSNSTNFAIVQCYFENSTTIRTRVRNLANTSDSYQIKVFYI